MLSVIVPTCNEEASLGGLLSDLSRFAHLGFEVVVSDGASQDGTKKIFEEHSKAFPSRWVDAPRGRGSQLNAGAKAARFDLLLFLHADTRLPRDFDLAAAVEFFLAQQKTNLAGRWGLKFSDTRGLNPRGVYYYEAKTFLPRLDVANGDQGLLIKREYLKRLGWFDESFPFMEDTALYAKIGRTGEVALLPGYLTTSARRFGVEGFFERQTLNALLKACYSMGLHDFFGEARSAYKTQHEAQKLDLLPFLRALHKVGSRGGLLVYLKNWMKTGAFVRNNAWQLAFARDARRGFEAGASPQGLQTPALRKMKIFDTFTANTVGDFLAGVLTFFAFYGLCFYLGARRK